MKRLLVPGTLLLLYFNGAPLIATRVEAQAKGHTKTTDISRFSSERETYTLVGNSFKRGKFICVGSTPKMQVGRILSVNQSRATITWRPIRLRGLQENARRSLAKLLRVTRRRCQEIRAQNQPTPTPTGSPDSFTPTPAPSPPGNPTATPTPIVATQSCTEIDQFGITWQFDHAYPCGQFVNGDWWVLGPVTITSVLPAWNGITNGTMINPTSASVQGYDSRIYGFTTSLRVSFPSVVPNGSSVISSAGLTTCASGGAAECLKDAAVLTILPEAVSANTFRPPYFGTAKPLFTTDQVNYGLLPSLPAPPVPTPDVSSYLVRPWIDQGPKGNVGSRCHPQNNMPPYSRDSSVQISKLAVMVLIDSTAQETLANRLVQHGIDLYSISLVNEDAWRAYGGFGNGRKWPILFAGILLNDFDMQHPDLMVPGSSYIFKFGEDGHTYYGLPTAEYPDGKPLWGQDCISGGYTYPFFSNHDCRDPNGILEAEQMPNGGGYRGCCTSHSWVGQILAAHLMDATQIWNHPATFDYVDRWTSEPESWVNNSLPFYQDIYGFGGDGNGFMKYMWEHYRN